jgi:hypothetical protein
MLRFDDHARDMAFDQLAIRGRRRGLPVTYVDHGVAVRAPALNINYMPGAMLLAAAMIHLRRLFSHRERDGKIVLDVLYERRSPFIRARLWLRLSSSCANIAAGK